MTAVLYPVAANAEAALSRPLGRAARASEAQGLAQAAVSFAQEAVGPAFPSREAALEAFAGRLDDDRPGRRAPEAQDRFCELREMLVEPPHSTKGSVPFKPVYRDGRRWPTPRAAPQTVWRVTISYWKVRADVQPQTPVGRLEPDQAAALRERLEQPLRARKIQKALDIGLFEVRPPEAPHILMPDE